MSVSKYCRNVVKMGKNRDSKILPSLRAYQCVILEVSDFGSFISLCVKAR